MSYQVYHHTAHPGGAYVASTEGLPYSEHKWIAMWIKDDGNVELGFRDLVGEVNVATKSVLNRQEFIRLVQLLNEGKIDLSTPVQVSAVPTRSVVV